MKWLRLATVTAVVFALGSAPAFGYLRMHEAKHYALQRAHKLLRHAEKVRPDVDVTAAWGLLDPCFRVTSTKVGCPYSYKFDSDFKFCAGTVMVVQRGRTVSTYLRHVECGDAWYS
jgi:hypothetical protein